MKTLKAKFIAFSAMLVLVIGVSLAFNTSKAKANGDICNMWHDVTQRCGPPELNCLCPIIVVGHKQLQKL